MKKKNVLIAGLLAAALALAVTGCIDPITDDAVSTVPDYAVKTGADNPAAAYTVVFHKNAADVTGDMDNQTYTYGTARNLSANAYDRDGYDFAGWNTEADGGGTTYTDSAGILNLTTAGEEVTLYAQWRAAAAVKQLTSAGQIASYLKGQTGGASAGDPITLAMKLQLSEANWNAIQIAIDTAGKFVSLDLAACTRSGSVYNGGLHSNGDFDPVNSTSTGKNKIVELTLPVAATSIDWASYPHDAAFKHFTALKTVRGAGVTRIDVYAFANCAALTEVYFPAAAYINNYAFAYCAALESVSFPATAEISSSAFLLTGPNLRFKLTGTGRLSTPDERMLIKNNNELVAYPSASGAVALPGSITAIREYAFYGNTALTGISAPAVTAIGNYAFEGCAALTSVTFPQVTAIGVKAFAGCTALPGVSFPQAAEVRGSTFYGCTNLTSASFPKAAAIGVYAFYGCTKLTLTNASFPKVTDIGNYAFAYCDALTSATFPEAARIGSFTASFAFAYCTKLATVKFPEAAAIGSFAFEECGALNAVTLGAAPPKLGVGLFYNTVATRTVTVTIPESAKSAYGVPNLAFDNGSTADSWGRAFKGAGWDGTPGYQNYYYLNNNITLRFDTD